ncbi:MAG: hypothetical protein AAB116_21735 [Candidatus Poribacteria bacterium]
MRVIVCDAGPIIHLNEANVLHLLKNIGEIILPYSVSLEILFASFFGMEVHGSLGIVLWNVAHDHISQREGERALSNLKQSSLWISTRVFQEALRAIKEMNL